MNESDTRLKKIDPALMISGWAIVKSSDVFTEQLADCDELKQAFLAKAFNGEL